MKPLVIYHGNCYDGFGAAWAAWREFREEAEYLPALYGDAVPVTADKDVYVLDFSYPRSVLEVMARSAHSFLVLDHHKTAQADLEGLPFCQFDMNKSGAVLAWEFFHSGLPVPDLLRYVEDRDLWRFSLPHSRRIAVWMRSWPMSFEVWNSLQWRLLDIDSVVLEAKAVERFQTEMVNTMADNARMQYVAGHLVPVTNATVFFSEVGEELCRRYPNAPFSAYYLDRKDGKRQWGLRSRTNFDVSKVAKSVGGGGHPGAAGFTTEIL